MVHAAGFKGRSELPQNVTDSRLSVEMLNLDPFVSTGHTTGGRSASAAETAKRLQRAD